ncbi:MAG: hypothetical protein AAFQ27_02860 [Pseudomonadota bacterium]
MLTVDDLKTVRAAPLEPDTIGIEIWTRDERLVAELIWHFDGRKVISMGETSTEIDATGFIEYISTLRTEIDQWGEELRKPGGAWDPHNPYYSEVVR